MESPEHSRPCPCCEGAGCEECDHKGSRYRHFIETEDGTVASFTGSGVAPSPETVEAMKALVAAAERKLTDG